MLRKREHTPEAKKPPILEKLETAVRDRVDMREFRFDVETDLSDGLLSLRWFFFGSTSYTSRGIVSRSRAVPYGTF